MKFNLFLVFAAFVIAVESLSVPKYGPQDRTRQYLRTKVDTRGGRILGGDPAEIENFPHMLSLLDLRFGGFICGASAVHEFWAVTAAHCLEFNSPASVINLRGGTANRLSGGQIFFAQSYTLHPQYDPFWLDFDVALIRVQNNSPFRGNNVQIIPISPPCNQECCHACEREDVTITGWGWDSRSYPVNLQQITLPIFNQAECDSIWGGIGGHFFCVLAELGRDSCSGDSGSPLIREVNGTNFQLGVVSFGSSNCGDGSGPSVNSRLEYPPIRNWIRAISGI